MSYKHFRLQIAQQHALLVDNISIKNILDTANSIENFLGKNNKIISNGNIKNGFNEKM